MFGFSNSENPKLDNVFWQGIQYGLILTFLIGPIFFALLQTGIEQGFRAGVALGSGVWVCDMLFIIISYFSLSLIERYADNPVISLIIGIVGGIVLIVFGSMSLITRPTMSMRPRKKPIRSNSYPGLIFKGMLLNAFNPFTILFWIALVSTVFLGADYSQREAFHFFLGLMLMIMFADTIKVLLAKRIRRWLSLRHLLWTRRITGLILFGFGIALIIRVLVT